MKPRRDENDDVRAVILELAPADAAELYRHVDALGFETATDAILDGPSSTSVFSTRGGSERLALIFALLGLEQ